VTSKLSLQAKNFVDCFRYHVPPHIQEHVDYITPGIRLANPKTNKGKRSNGLGNTASSLMKRSNKRQAENSSCENIITYENLLTPRCIQLLYDVPLADKAAPSNVMGIFETTGPDGVGLQQDDLNEFFQNLAPYIPNGTHPTLDSISGGFASTIPMNISYRSSENLTLAQTFYLGDTIETTLDVQCAYPLIYPQKIKAFLTGQQTNQDLTNHPVPLNNFLDAIDGVSSADSSLDSG